MPYDDTTLDLVRQALVMTLKIAGPILLAGVAIGLLVSVLQTITTINDQTVTFVPKIVVMLAVALLLLSWIVDWLLVYTVEMFRLS